MAAEAAEQLLESVGEAGEQFDEWRIVFHEAIKRAALSPTLTQRQVAEAAGLSVGRVNQIIHGNG